MTDGEAMRRWLCFLLILGLAVIPIQASDAPKYVALTFDDGPNGRFTKNLLDGLEQRGICATFFLSGYRVEQFPQLAKRIAQQGNEIGNHGYSHKLFTKLTPEGVCADLSRSAEAIREATGQEPTLLRPPGGLFDAEILKNIPCANLPIILWSVDPMDWCCKDAATIAKRVTSKVKDGDIILMHDMSESSVEAAFRIIDTLELQGYEFVTVSELAWMCGTRMENGVPYYRFSKKASISLRVADTEPWTKPGFPPPLPFSAVFSSRVSSRRSPSKAPMA